MKKGVYEYLTKPLNLDELFIVIKKAEKERRIYLENLELRNQVTSTYKFENMIGNSKAMKHVFSVIAKVARSQSTVLIRGESGVGKELVVRAIHYNSPRADKPLIENAVVLGEGNMILPEHLPFVIYSQFGKEGMPSAEKLSGNTHKAKMESAERIILQDAINSAGGNKSKAAEKLGISLRTMRYKIRKYGL